MKWYCAVKKNGTILAKSFDLVSAQRTLGIGSSRSPQAIIPMEGQAAGDPHTLDKEWSGGSMWWQGWEDINKMRAICERTSIPEGVSDIQY